METDGWSQIGPTWADSDESWEPVAYGELPDGLGESSWDGED